MWIKDRKFFVIVFCLAYLVRIHYLYSHSEDFVDYQGFIQFAVLWLLPFLMIIFPYAFALFISASPRGAMASDSGKPENSVVAVKFLGWIGIILLVWIFESAF